jgi:hypothetical protein
MSEEEKSRCQNCTKTWAKSQLNPIKDIFQRVDPGVNPCHQASKKCEEETNTIVPAVEWKKMTTKEIASSIEVGLRVSADSRPMAREMLLAMGKQALDLAMDVAA